MCVMDTVSCNPGECERAKGHYNRVNEAVYDMLIHEHKMSRDMIEKYAEKHQNKRGSTIRHRKLTHPLQSYQQ